MLSVSNALVLNGTLQVSLAGGFQNSITAAQTFAVASTLSTLSGSFSNVANGGTLLTSDGFGLFKVNYGAGSPFAVNSVVLSDFVPVPEPATWTLFLTGTAILLLIRRRAGPGPGSRGKPLT